MVTNGMDALRPPPASVQSGRSSTTHRRAPAMPPSHASASQSCLGSRGHCLRIARFAPVSRPRSGLWPRNDPRLRDRPPRGHRAATRCRGGRTHMRRATRKYLPRVNGFGRYDWTARTALGGAGSYTVGIMRRGLIRRSSEMRGARQRVVAHRRQPQARGRGGNRPTRAQAKAIQNTVALARLGHRRDRVTQAAEAIASWRASMPAASRPSRSFSARPLPKTQARLGLSELDTRPSCPTPPPVRPPAAT